MIPQLVEFLQQNGLGHDVRAALLNGGVARRRERYRSVAILFSEGRPLYVARWCYGDGESIRREEEILRELNTFAAPVPRRVNLIEMQGTLILLEEFIPGKSLQTLVERKLLSPDAAIAQARIVLEDFSLRSQQVSNAQELASEMHSRRATITGLALDEALKEQLVIDVLRVEELLRNHGCVTQIVHNDFCLKNICRQSEKHVVIDLEFSQRSHFIFLDWFRLFRYSRGIDVLAIQTLTPPAALAPLFADARAVRGMQLLFELRDMEIKKDVFPRALHEQIEKDALQRIRLISNSSATEYFESWVRAEVEPGEDRVSGEVLDALEVQRQAEKLRIRFENVELMLAKQGRRASELREERDKTFLELVAANKELAELRAKREEFEMGQSEYHRLHGRVAELEGILQHKEDLIQSIIRSVSFRIGHAMTSVVKRFPGSEKVKSALRH